MKFSTVLVVALLCGCADSPPPTQEITFGPLSFEITADWQRKDTSKPGWASSMFTPSDNRRHESVTVIRSRRSDSKNSTFEQLLVNAQRSLNGVKISNVRQIKTANGLVGAHVDISFKPEGATQTYRRSHVVLAESESVFVHVIYTAKVIDGERLTMRHVLDTLRVARDGGRS